MSRKFLVPILAAIVLFPVAALGQTAPNNIPASAPISNVKPVIVANVNLSGATILKETPQAITVGLDLENQGDTPQSDIKYGVEILKITKEGQTTVDTLISPEIITLAPKQLLHKEIQYQVPSYLHGEYDVWAVGKTTSGLALGLGNAGKVNLSQKQDSLTIMPDSCYLKVNNAETKYNLSQGVDLAQSETLTLTCNAQNNSNSQLTVAPNINTFRRSLYGPSVNISYPTQSDITFAAQEKKDFTLNIPKAPDPQAYDAVISLTQDKAIIAEKIIAHYVIQGQSATIQNIQLDKENYQSGDTISAKLFWSPSADNFPSSRAGKGTELPKVTVTLNITDASNDTCIAPFSQEVTIDKTISILTLPAISNCSNPKASVSLSSGSDQLDARNIESPKSPVQAQPVKIGLTAKRILLIFISILFVVSLVIIFWKTRGKKFRVKSLIFLAFVVGGLVVGRGQAMALTYTIPGAMTTGNFNINHPSSYIYSYGEQFSMSGDLSVAECLNGSTGWNVQVNEYHSMTTNACNTSLSTPGDCFGGAGLNWGKKWTASETNLQSITKYFSGTMQMPSQASAQGTNPWTTYARLDVTASLPGSTGNYAYMTFFLNLPKQPINGVCGTANGVARTAAPSAGLCSTGSASFVASGATAYTWTCTGSNGGTPASCSAPRLSNGCEVNTCVGQTCNNGVNPTAPGILACDNGCAANTCTTTTCNNSITTVAGTKTCPDNGCAAITCSGQQCYNNLTWVSGIKTCASVGNGNCSAASTCSDSMCWDGAKWISGTKACTTPSVSFGGTLKGDDCSLILVWTSSGATSCTPTSGPAGWMSLNLGTSGQWTTILNGSQTYKFSCSSASGGTNTGVFSGSCTLPVLTDNGCAANTCIGDTCDNGINALTAGTKAPTYSDYNCTQTDAAIKAFCADTKNCSRGITTTAADFVCMAKNNCTGFDDSRNTSECTAKGIPCPSTAKTIKCPGCPIVVRPGGFIEVAPGN